MGSSTIYLGFIVAREDFINLGSRTLSPTCVTHSLEYVQQQYIRSHAGSEKLVRSLDDEEVCETMIG